MRVFFLLDELSYTQHLLSLNLLSHEKEPHLLQAALSRTWLNGLNWLLGLCLTSWLLLCVPQILPVRGKLSCPSSGHVFLRKVQSRRSAQGKQTTATKPWMEHQQSKCLKSSCSLKVTFNTRENIAADRTKKTSKRQHKRGIKYGWNLAWLTKTNKQTQTTNPSFVESSVF